MPLSLQMSRKNKIVFIVVLVLAKTSAFAQTNVRDSSIFAPLICPSYSLQFPGADMAKRFGINSALGLQILVKTRSNWIVGVSGDFIFSNQVRETGMLDSITSDGFLIANNGKLVDTRYSERGFTAFIKFGRLFNRWAPNPNSGIVAMAGIGFLEHHIRIDLIDGNSTIAPQLTDQLKKGYDRLTNGIAFSQFLGYMYLSNNRIANFFGGFELTEGITSGARAYQYDLMKKDDAQRTDILYGIRVGWILPLYKKAPKEFYTY